MKTRNLLFAVLLIGLLTFGAFAQSKSTPKSFAATEPELLDDNEQFVVTFHRPVLNEQGKPARIAGTNTVKVSDALSQAEIKQGFKVGDRVVVRIKAPVDSFVYVVNNSKWDGSYLTNKATPLKKDAEQDFVYRLSNNQGSQGAGSEELMFLIRRTAFTDAELNQYLTKSSADTLPKVKMPEPTEATKAVITDFKKESKVGGVIKVGCNVASIFFPWVSGICKATGFGAAEPEPLPGDATGLSPQKDAENMVVQISFPVTQ